MDGRDTDPRSGKGFIEQLENHLQTTGGKIASIIGRYYAMDRDKRWERVKEAYDLIMNGTGKPCEDMVQAMEESYAEGVTDEFIKPIVHVENGKPVATIEEGDVVIFFNYRNDRAKELTVVLTQQDMPEAGMKTIPNLQYFCMTPYDASFKGVHILFDIFLCVDGFNQFVFYLESTHFRFQVVSGHFRRRNQDTVFTFERSFASAVEEESNVCIFFCFGNVQLCFTD